MIDQIRAFIPTAAKAVAAFAAPFILVGIMWVVARLGVDVAVDATQIETWVYAAIMAVLQAAGVYQVANREGA